VKRQTDRDPYRGRDPRLIPAYSTFDAARYLRLPDRTIRNWAFGYTFGTAGGRTGTTKPLIDVADPRQHQFSFVNLLELHVLNALRRDHNVQMVKIRRAIDYMKERLDSAHPLIDEEMASDGVNVFVEKYGSFINASENGQLAMKALLQAHLRRIDRDERGVAIRLFPFTRTRVANTVDSAIDQPRVIAIDPAVAFGRPVIVGSRVPTAEVFDRFNAGESADDLAADFGRTRSEIEEALRCEAAAAA
jgi:uncharacterized protein (DUF433 family)